MLSITHVKVFIFDPLFHANGQCGRASTSGKGQSEGKPFPSSAQLVLRQHTTARRRTACPCSSVALASLRGWRRENVWPPPVQQEQRVMHSALLAEVRAELVFLLFGQVGLNDFELLTLDRLSNSIDHRTTLQQEQRRSAWRDLGTHLVDEALVDPITRKVHAQSAP